MRAPRTVILLAGAALVLAACGSDSEESASTEPVVATEAPAAADDTAVDTEAPAETDPPADTEAPAETDPPVDTEPPAEEPAETDPPVETEAPAVVPQALQFSAPLVGGGEIDAATLADKPTVFWFWAPT